MTSGEALVREILGESDVGLIQSIASLERQRDQQIAEISLLREVVRILVSGDESHRNCTPDECMISAIKGSGVVQRALRKE